MGQRARELLDRIGQSSLAVQFEHEQFRHDRGGRRGRIAAAAAASGLASGSSRRSAGSAWARPSGSTRPGATGPWSTRPGSAARSATALNHTLPTRQRDVLLTIHQVGDGRSHGAAKSGIDVGKLFALVGAVCDKVSLRGDLDDQIPRGADRSPANTRSHRSVPALLLRDRIPGAQLSTSAFLGWRGAY